MSTYLHLAIPQDEPAPSRPFRGINLTQILEAVRLEQIKNVINDIDREESKDE